MNDKRFNYFKIIIDIIFGIVIYLIYFYSLYNLGFLEWLKLEPSGFFSKFLFSVFIIWLVHYISYVISVVWHEIGHLVFGIKAKLKFLSFNFLVFSISKEHNKLVIKIKKTINDFKGSCYMFFDEDEKYNKKDIILYFIGGIIFNFIFVLIFLILLIINNNLYLDIVCMFFIVLNIYSALYNSVPSTLKSGVTTDMLKIIECLKDPQYIKVMGKSTQIQNMLSNGISLKDMDKKLFYKPKKFVYSSDVFMAQFYIDYIASKGKYNEAMEYAKQVLKDAKNILSKSDINLLKTQLINYAFTDTKNLDMISEYWDDELEKYLRLMGRVYPGFLAIIYIYSLTVEKNEEKANEILDNFYKLEKKYSNKKDVENTKKLIEEFNKKNS